MRQEMHFSIALRLKLRSLVKLLYLELTILQCFFLPRTFFSSHLVMSTPFKTPLGFRLPAHFILLIFQTSGHL
jgi:hypothetical protein